MKKRLIATVLGLTAASLALPSFAQFGGLGALGGGGSSVSADSLVKNYVTGTQLVINSDAMLLKALGLKDQSAQAELSAKNLTQGATVGALEEAAKLQTENNKALAEAMSANKVTLSADSKKDYARGVLELVKGIKAYVGMAGDVKGFKPSLASVGSSGSAALFVVKSLPGSLSSLKDTLKRSIAFAKENNVQLPADATAALPG
jgi:hypothetical protein